MVKHIFRFLSTDCFESNFSVESGSCFYARGGSFGSGECSVGKGGFIFADE